MFLNHLRAAELSQGCSSNAEAAVHLASAGAMDPDALPTTINWVTFIAQPPTTSRYQPRTAHDSSQFSATHSHVHIGRSSRSRYVNSAFSKLHHFHYKRIPHRTPGHIGPKLGGAGMSDHFPPRLARRERDVPIPSPDNVDAMAATLADWGAEHRPHEPCTECGCTLWWTAAGADICAICLPMPRLTDESRERIDNFFPRTRGHETSANAWSKPPPGHGVGKCRQGRTL